jgi:diadenosine tetraphosphate (Ap4A) HIT family hydrolase
MGIPPRAARVRRRRAHETRITASGTTAVDLPAEYRPSNVFASCECEANDVDLKPWPSDFLRKKRGAGCPQCLTGRVDETQHGVRYFEGLHADGYLQRQGPTLGYSVVVFRGRHVGDPQSMTAAEHAGFWTDVSTVATAIEAAFGPIHLNFQILGNQDPHVHVHIVPRYDPDPAPSLPLPAEAWSASRELTAAEMTSQTQALRAYLHRQRNPNAPA